jgi:hypothetical protein
VTRTDLGLHGRQTNTKTDADGQRSATGMNEMETKFNRCMVVNHTIEGENHVVRIYPPASKYEYKTGKWPVTDDAPSLEAIWSGVFEAKDACDLFGADGIAVFSTDSEAFAAYCAELDCDE